MRRVGQWLVLISCLAISSVNNAHADPVASVKDATTAMDQWLGTDANADAWRQYLQVDRLNQLISEGPGANPIQIMEALSRFEQPVAGLETPEFLKVRDALRAWVDATMTNKAVAEWVSKYPGQFNPISNERIHAARKKAESAARELSEYLSLGSSANAAAWKKYLLWEPMERQLKSDAPSPEELGKSIAPYYTGQPGLEFKEFVKLREALLEYRRLLIAKDDPEIQKRYADQLSNLSKELAEDKLAPSQIAARLEWFEQLGQAEDVVSGVRDQFDLANFYFSASAETIAKGMADKVDQQSPVNEVILGTRIRGVAHTIGDVSARLVPDANKAVVEVVLQGVSYSNTIGRQKPVSVFSRGTTQILGRKLLVIEPEGVFGMPATARCSTNTRIRGIRADGGIGSRLVEKIAWKRAYRQKAQAERISSRRAERRVANLMDEQASELIANSNQRLNREIRRPLTRRNIFPRWVRLWTTKRRLNMRALQGRNVQLAADTRPPKAPEHEVVMQAHESLFLNSAVNAMGGYLMTDERAQDLVKEVTGEVPEELKIKEDDDPWSITFDRLQPLSIEFKDDQVRIAIRGRRFTRAGQAVRQTMEIAATYSVETEDGRAKLVRQGDIEVTYPGKEGERLSLTELRNKTFMTNKFEGLFKSEFKGEGVKLPDRLKQLEDLQLDFISASDGWLSLGWN